MDEQIETVSSSELTRGIGEFFKNKLGLSAYIIVGVAEDLKDLPFALEGTTEDLGTLVRAILSMTPPSVQKAVLKAELRFQHEEAGKQLEDI